MSHGREKVETQMNTFLNTILSRVFLDGRNTHHGQIKFKHYHLVIGMFADVQCRILASNI